MSEGIVVSIALIDRLDYKLIRFYSNYYPAGGLHLCLKAKTKQKVQGYF